MKLNYYVIKKTKINGIKKINIINTFNDLNSAQEYCCKQLGLYKTFDKFKFFNKKDILHII